MEDSRPFGKPDSDVGRVASAHVIAVAQGASKAMEALDRHEQEWDLAVVDLLLKEGSGLSVLRAARDRSPHQAWSSTNYSTAEIGRRCLELEPTVFDKSIRTGGLFRSLSSYGA